MLHFNLIWEIRIFVESTLLKVLTLWTRRAGLAAYANRGPETRQASFPAFAMVCQKPEEHLNRRT